MKKSILCASLIALGMMYSCSKDEAVPEGSMPEWLGESIYSELENPVNLTGTFNTYMRLVDDLGYKDVLSKTGSKTIFPANDEAFDRFFAQGGNSWGVTNYNQLTTAQKKVLFYNSMIDNSLLINMLSNVTGGSTTVVNDIAIKHASNISVTDSITMLQASQIPVNNSYWDKFRSPGKVTYVVTDNTKPQIVHFTKNFLTNKGITTSGSESDFAILTGDSATSSDNVAYVYDDKIIKSDITCKNGYIHQVQNVLVQPGNIASVLRQESNTKYFSRICDYFAAPYYDASTTSSYNSNIKASGEGSPIDSIFQWRYISKRSQGGEENLTDPNGSQVSSSKALKFDIGWNTYYPDHKNSGSVDYSLADIGAIFVPTDAALWNFFGEGSGSYILENYMKPGNPNDKEHFGENLDSLQSQNPGVLTAFVNNLLQTQFTASVPSKFYTLTNDATENLGMNLSLLQKKDNGKYDIRICNNGVIYKMNTVLAPAEYTAVLAPASIYDDLKVMNWAIQDRTVLGLDFKFYLLAMSANYALFLPDDEAFSTNYYIDPCTWAHSDATGATAVRFYYDTTQKDDSKKLRAEVHKYNKTTNTVDPAIVETYDASVYKTQIGDILNTHTVLLETGETFGDNHWYMSKSGAGLYIDKAAEGGLVSCGLSLYNNVKPATIEHDWKQENGHSYRIDSPIQPTMTSVYATLKNESRFEQFFDYVNFFSTGSEEILAWAGVSDELDEKTNTYPTDRYKIFLGYLQKNDNNKNRLSQNALDMNVRLFNTYNYTVYAPNNAAMQKAYNMGLPQLSEMEEIYNTYAVEGAEEQYGTAVIDEKKAELLNMIEVAQEFIRYHLQTKSLFVDNNGDTDEYSTLFTDDLGVAKKLTVTTGNNQITIQDATSTVKTVSKSSLVNLIARDWQFDKKAEEATSINTSSYAAIHELTEPLCPEASGRFDANWATAKIRKYYGQNYAALVKKVNIRNQKY